MDISTPFLVRTIQKRILGSRDKNKRVPFQEHFNKRVFGIFEALEKHCKKL
jgi:hypothetical protein